MNTDKTLDKLKRRKGMVFAALFVVLLGLTVSAIGEISGNPDICGADLSFEVRGNSLSPIVESGQTLLVNENYSECGGIKKEDLIVYNWTGNEDPIVKKVKAVPGDPVQLDGCNIKVNGEKIETTTGEPYCISGNRRSMIGLYTSQNITGYLLLGNQPGGTLDSTRFGIVEGRAILGKVISKTDQNEDNG